MAPEPDAIWLLALAAKDAVIDHYASEGVDLPERQLVTPGLPAWDFDSCGGLYVHAENTFGIGGAVTLATIEAQSARPAHMMRAVRVAVTLLRCVPPMADDGSPPSVEDEEAAAEVILNDAQLVLNSLRVAAKAGDLPGCSGLAFENWESVGPDGGLAGGILRVLLSVGV